MSNYAQNKMYSLKLSKTTCYLLTIENGYLLVDTGYAEDKALFFKELNKLKINITDIKFVFLTHHHDDHAGLLNDLVKQNPNIRIIMNVECSKLLKIGENARNFGGAWCCKNMKFVAELYRKINAKWTLSFPPYFYRDVDILLPNEDFCLKNIVVRDYKAIYSPGHSIDCISLLDENMNLFCGDASANYLRIIGTKYAAPFITDLSQFYKTWQKFIDLGIKQIYPSHGKKFSINKIKQNINKLSKSKMGEFQWD